MDTFRVVDQVRSSRGRRQRADKALLKVEEAEEPERTQLLVQALTQLSESVAALEQALLGVVETQPAHP